MTVVLDDELLAEAQRLTGMTEKTALLRQALRALVERETKTSPPSPSGSRPMIATCSRYFAASPDSERERARPAKHNGA
jgi:hypothetical protein